MGDESNSYAPSGNMWSSQYFNAPPTRPITLDMLKEAERLLEAEGIIPRREETIVPFTHFGRWQCLRVGAFEDGIICQNCSHYGHGPKGLAVGWCKLHSTHRDWFHGCSAFCRWYKEGQ